MNSKNTQMITKLMFRLLPVQAVLAAIGSINGIVSGFFAANYVGIDAMSAVSLYGPLSMFIGAVGTMITGGCAVICGKYLGRIGMINCRTFFPLISFCLLLFPCFLQPCSCLWDFSGRQDYLHPIRC